MNTKLIFTLMLIPILGFGQFQDSCKSKNGFKPIFNLQGDSVGIYCNYFKPIQVLGNLFEVGEFIKIIVNEKANRIYVLDCLNHLDNYGDKRFLKIFNLSGDIILDSNKKTPTIITASSIGYDKFIKIAPEGKILLWGRSSNQTQSRKYIFKILDRDGGEILIKEEEKEITKKGMNPLLFFHDFDINNKGDFISIKSNLNSLNENDMNEYQFSKYNITGKLIWEKHYKLQRLRAIDISDNGKIVFINIKDYPKKLDQELVVLNKRGKIIQEISIDPNFVSLNFIDGNKLELRNEPDSKLKMIYRIKIK